jgi:hypothetical protein
VGCATAADPASPAALRGLLAAAVVVFPISDAYAAAGDGLCLRTAQLCAAAAAAANGRLVVAVLRRGPAAGGGAPPPPWEKSAAGRVLRGLPAVDVSAAVPWAARKPALIARIRDAEPDRPNPLRLPPPLPPAGDDAEGGGGAGGAVARGGGGRAGLFASLAASNSLRMSESGRVPPPALAGDEWTDPARVLAALCAGEWDAWSYAGHVSEPAAAAATHISSGSGSGSGGGRLEGPRSVLRAARAARCGSPLLLLPLHIPSPASRPARSRPAGPARPAH